MKEPFRTHETNHHVLPTLGGNFSPCDQEDRKQKDLNVSLHLFYTHMIVHLYIDALAHPQTSEIELSTFGAPKALRRQHNSSTNDRDHAMMQTSTEDSHNYGIRSVRKNVF